MLQSLLTNSTALNATTAVVARPTAEDLEKYGFHDPYSVAELNLAVLQGTNTSSTTTASGSSGSGAAPAVYYNVQPHKVVIGSKNDDGNYYVMVDDMVSIYEVSAASLPWAEAVYENAISTSLFNKNITDVSAITIRTADGETRFDLTQFPDKENSDDKLQVIHDGQTYPTDDFRAFGSS